MGKIMILAFSENENGLYDEILQDICRNRKVNFVQEFEDKSTIRIENIEINIEHHNPVQSVYLVRFVIRLNR